MASQDSFFDLSFPKAGLDLSGPFTLQRPNTSPAALNVRGFEAGTNRLRGGTRPGLSRYVNARVGSVGWIVQEVNQITYQGTPGAGMQTNSSGRIVYLVAVSKGNVYYTTAGGTAWTAATNNSGASPPLNFTGIVRSAPNNLKLYFADGNNWRYFDPSDTSVNTWAATAGTLPVDADSNKPRLICTWRGRTVLSGLLKDPQNWFMSAANDPTDFDYAPLSPSPTDAVAGNNAPQGLIGDVITALVPYSDDILIFGGDHSLYMMRGDPAAGGELDLVSDTIGMAWGIPWCKDPYGVVYFVSNRCGVYSLVPGQAPQRISQQIEQLVQDLDTGANTIRLAWDDRFQGLHIFVTPTANAAAGEGTLHFFYEQRTGAWWQDTFGNKNHNPLCCVTFDGNLASDRVALIGSWDGYVRWFDPDATDDDGTDIESSVIVGPLVTRELDEVLFKDGQAVLGEESGDVSYDVYVGSTAEGALASDPVSSGTWEAGRNPTSPIRCSGHALWVKISATNPWAMELFRARVAGKGKVARRRFS